MYQRAAEDEAKIKNNHSIFNMSILSNPLLEDHGNRKSSNHPNVAQSYSSTHSDLYARYFQGPRDLDTHSKYPLFLRLHGSALPRMIVPLFVLGCWAVLITYISHEYVSLAAEPLLLTVLGIVVGLCLSFRSSTAYERYSEGRRSWTTLKVHCRALVRLIWIHIPEGPNTDEEPDRKKTDLMAKISAINLVLAFAVALKHQLRFEPYTHYNDLAPLIGHLDTYAKMAHDPVSLDYEEIPKKQSIWKKIGQFLSLECAMSNPRKVINRANAPLGNLPLEILTFISSYVHQVCTLNSASAGVSTVTFTQIMNTLIGLTDVQAQTERILTTPLPLSYKILISQLVFLYTYLLPFQLYRKLGWVTVPATLAAAYIIIGISVVGNELENPFGNDVNDLPLDQYCSELRQEIDLITSKKPCDFMDVVLNKDNMILWPLSLQDHQSLHERSVKEIRDVLRAKAYIRKDDQAHF